MPSWIVAKTSGEVVSKARSSSASMPSRRERVGLLRRLRDDSFSRMAANIAVAPGLVFSSFSLSACLYEGCDSGRWFFSGGVLKCGGTRGWETHAAVGPRSAAQQDRHALDGRFP